MKNEYYKSAEARLDTVVGRHVYWEMLRSANQEYYSKRGIPTGATLLSFEDYMKDMYGIVVESDREGNILPTHTIVDKEKYLIFVLKHTKHEN